MRRFHTSLMLCAALFVYTGVPALSRGGGGFAGGHSMGSHFSGSSHTSVGHFGGSGHMSIGSHFGGAGHMSMGSFFGGHSLSSSSFHGSSSSFGNRSHSSSWHFSTNHSHSRLYDSAPGQTLTPGEMHHLTQIGASSFEPSMASGVNLAPAVHHGFVHGLARLFGFAPPGRAAIGSQLPAIKRSENAIASNIPEAVKSLPVSAYLSPYVRAYNPYFNPWARRYYPHLSWWYPYLGSYWGTAFPYNFYSPWYLPDYYPLLLFGYLDPAFYSSFCPSMYFPYTSAFADSAPTDPYFIAGDNNSDINGPNVQAFNPINDGWSPPAYDPSSGIVDPELVPFELSLPSR